jgi:DNA-binding MarR family transcriptional regulator
VRVLAELLEAPLDKIGLIQRLQEKGVIRDDIGKHAYARVNSFLSGLVARGFVEVIQGPDHDRRRQAIVLTEAGRQAHKILSLGVKAPKTTIHLRAGAATQPKSSKPPRTSDDRGPGA